MLFGLLLVLALAGCATSASLPPAPPPPSAEEIAAAPVGQIPKNWQDQIRSYWNARLLDPTSPEYDFGTPEKGYFSERGETVFGWVVPYHLSSKNRFGNYDNPAGFAAFFSEGRLKVILKAGQGSFYLLETL